MLAGVPWLLMDFHDAAIRSASSLWLLKLGLQAACRSAAVQLKCNYATRNELKQDNKIDVSELIRLHE